MSKIFPTRGFRTQTPTWDKFKAEIRKVDRDSLLSQAAATTALMAQDALPDEAARLGLTPWNIADVARTSLAWGSFARPEADLSTLVRLCSLNAKLADEGLGTDGSSEDRLGRVLSRSFFEQFPGQRSVMAELSRSLLLFGSAAEHPNGFKPEAMTPGWFETIMSGLSLDEYVEALFLISVVTQQNRGGFTLDLLESPALQGLEEAISLEAVRRTFTDHLVTTAADFKNANRKHQDPVPAAQKKFAFNPLADKPFISDVAELPVAPWMQAIISKALPPAIYHLARPKLGEPFTRDLGAVFQHYTGRQLALVDGDTKVIAEVAYGTRRAPADSCDWFLDLPGVLVLIECKARQPIESLRIGGADWLNSIEGSINRGIKQLNRSNQDIDKISSAFPQIDSTKPRVGLVVTLEPFYLSQNWPIQDHLQEADLPVAVVSIAELESLVLLTAGELSGVLRDAAASGDRVMTLAYDSVILGGRVNPLLDSTWDSIGLFNRAQTIGDRLRPKQDDAG